MGSGLPPPPVRVYRTSRWLTRILGAFFLALGVAFFAAVGSIVLLIVLGATGLVFLVAGERRRIRVTAEGVVSVPPFGRARTYPWSEIDGFIAQQYVARYSGWVVAMHARDRWVNLPATQIANVNAKSHATVAGLAQQLNLELERARGSR